MRRSDAILKRQESFAIAITSSLRFNFRILRKIKSAEATQIFSASLRILYREYASFSSILKVILIRKELSYT